jgi:hypothetical protein
MQCSPNFACSAGQERVAFRFIKYSKEQAKENIGSKKISNMVVINLKTTHWTESAGCSPLLTVLALQTYLT